MNPTREGMTATQAREQLAEHHLVHVSICDGKYTIIQDGIGRIKVLRYGEEWRDVTGDNVIGGAAYEIERLRNEVDRLKSALEFGIGKARALQLLEETV